MANVIVRDPRPGDVLALVADMRPADYDEVAASSAQTVLASVEHGLAVSAHRWAVDIDGQLALLGGVRTVSLLEGVGSPWLLGTRRVERFPGALTKLGIQYSDVSLRAFPYLFNYVDARNVKAIRWLRRIGFTMGDEPVPYGPQNMPFYRFEMRN